MALRSPGRRSVLGGGLTVAVLLAAQLVLGASPAAASTTLVVSTTSDIGSSVGACGDVTIVTPPASLSLREAVCLANNIGGAVTIDVPAGTYFLGNGQLDVGTNSGQDVIIDGAGASVTTITAQDQSRVLDYDVNLLGGVAGTLSGVTITGGADSTVGGAGIIAGSANAGTADTLDISDSIITGNQANTLAPDVTNNPGGGLQFIGGSLSIEDSTISDNGSQSSPGSGAVYVATGATSGEGLTITGSTFSGNSATNTAGSSVTNGGALDLRGLSSTHFSVTNSQFTDNTVAATTGGALGAGIRQESGALTVTGSTFTGNSVGGGSLTAAGGAIEVTTGTATLNDNRIVGNVAASGSAIHVGAGAGSVDATENWFGCNAGPGSVGCDTVSGSADVTPWLVLTASANPSTVDGPDGTSDVTAGFTTDSASNPVSPASLGAFSGLPIGWSDPEPSPATVDGGASASTDISAGTADVTYDSQSSSGSGHVIAAFDSQSVTVPIDVIGSSPVITSDDATTIAINTLGTFTVTTTGDPTATLGTTGTLPGWLSFTDNGDGTGSLTGTPPADSAGDYTFGLTATNGFTPDASQSFTLSVTALPTFDSLDHTSFTVGTDGSFTVTTTAGFPADTTLSEAGALPDGVIFTDNGDGTATLAGTPTAGSAGGYPVTLTAANTSGHTDQPFMIDVAQVSQTITITSTPPDPATIGGTYPVTATASSGLPVSFSVDDSTTNSACSISDSTVDFDNPGSCVIDADQAGDGTYQAAAEVQQTVTVAAVKTDVTVVTSPTATVYGQPVTATATVSADSGSPTGVVQFTVDDVDLGAPVTVSGGQATSIGLTDGLGHSLAPGSHTVTVGYIPDTSTYAAGTGTTHLVVAKAATSTTIVVHVSKVTATVTPTAPGAGAVTGSVKFTVDGSSLGTAGLVDGVATLDRAVPSGMTQHVAARYSGDANFTGSSISLARHDPTITATVTSAHPKHDGWYRSAVTVTFDCMTNGASLTAACPSPAHRTHEGGGQSVTRTITAINGGAATVVVSPINIDETPPTVHVTGIHDGAVYAIVAPTGHCVASDALSGVASCTLTLHTHGTVTTYKATAIDRAGNSSSVSGSYRTLAITLEGATLSHGAFTVQSGHTYTLVVHADSRPTYYDAAPYPATPTTPGLKMFAAGHDRWTLGITMAGLGSHRFWNLGVKVGATVDTIKIRVT